MAESNTTNLNYDDPSALPRTRLIPADVPDDIAYDAFKIEFEKATIKNSKHKNRFRISSDNAAGVGFNQRQLLDVTLDLDHQQQQQEEGEGEEGEEEEEEEEGGGGIGLGGLTCALYAISG